MARTKAKPSATGRRKARESVVEVKRPAKAATRAIAISRSLDAEVEESPWRHGSAKPRIPGPTIPRLRRGLLSIGIHRSCDCPGAATRRVAAKKGVLLSGGNPQIAKGEGDAPVRAYIAAMPGWKRDVGRRLDAIIERAAPGVRKAVKWNSPFYGIDGRGWFLSFHVFTRYVKVAFFRGASLRPMPPGMSKDKNTRYIDIRETDRVDESQFAAWVKQAARLPGWEPKGGAQ